MNDVNSASRVLRAPALTQTNHIHAGCPKARVYALMDACAFSAALIVYYSALGLVKNRKFVKARQFWDLVVLYNKEPEGRRKAMRFFKLVKEPRGQAKIPTKIKTWVV